MLVASTPITMHDASLGDLCLRWYTRLSCHARKTGQRYRDGVRTLPNAPVHSTATTADSLFVPTLRPCAKCLTAPLKSITLRRVQISLFIAFTVSTKIEDVARLAGVSTATVSRVLSGKPYVSDDLRRRVLETIQELNYRPSRVARSLRVQRSSIIGLIISDIQNPFFTSVVRAVEDFAQQRQYSVFLCNSDEDVEKELTYIELMLAEQVAGIIVSPTASSNEVYRQLAARQIPVVAIDRGVDGVPIDMVVGDNIDAAHTVVSHLVENGYRRIGAVLGTPDASTGAERYQGYVNALIAHDLPLQPELVRSGLPRSPNGYVMMNELLQLAQPPDAVFTGNNLLTVGVLRAIHERGLRIPDDIALAAFDEMDWMFLVKPALTVVMQPTYEMGRRAAELLLERIVDPHRPPQKIVLQPTIKVRESSRRVATHAQVPYERGW